MSNVLDDFETWARLSARLLGRPTEQIEAMLQHHGVGAHWAAADARWSKLLCDDMASGDRTRLDRYGELCEEELRRRGQTSPTPAGDFRAELMRGHSSAPPPPAQDGLPQADFAAEMVAPLPAPAQPEPNQQGTRGPDLGALSEFLAAARDAAGWPVQRYAAYWAELAAHPERAEQIHHQHGLGRPEVRNHVVDVWNERFAEDPGLHRRWQTLVAEYRAATSEGD